MSEMRVPPNSARLERAMIAALVSGGDAWDLTRNMVEREDFYAAVWQEVYDACVFVAGPNRTPDLTQVMARLDAMNRSDLVERVLDATNAEPMADARAVEIARDLRRLTRRRRVLLACMSAIATGYSADVATDDWIANTEAAVFSALQDDSIHSGPRRISMHDAMERFKVRAQSYKAGLASSIDTGIPLIDEWLRMSPGDLVIIGGRPGEGKTALAQQIADRAVSRGIPGLTFSMEMPEEQLVDRKFAARACLPLTDLRRGALSEWHWDRIAPVAAELDKWPLYIDDTPSISIAALQSAVKLAVRRWGIKFVIVDYVQLMRAGARRKGESREQEVAAISGGLKAIAMEAKVPVIALAQFNRGPEQRGDGRPKKSDFRESGALEQDADAALLIWRQKDKSTLILDKNRFGPTGDVAVEFHGARTMFVQSERQQTEGEARSHDIYEAPT
jgi:replicative DNA helicase